MHLVTMLHSFSQHQKLNKPSFRHFSEASGDYVYNNNHYYEFGHTVVPFKSALVVKQTGLQHLVSAFGLNQIENNNHHFDYLSPPQINNPSLNYIVYHTLP
jgi:hypothetical protein